MSITIVTRSKCVHTLIERSLAYTVHAQCVARTLLLPYLTYAHPPFPTQNDNSTAWNFTVEEKPPNH